MPCSWISFLLCAIVSFFLQTTKFYSDNIDCFSVIYIAIVSYFVLKDIQKFFPKECESVLLFSYFFRLFLLYFGITHHGTSLQLPNDMDSDGYQYSAELIANSSGWFKHYYGGYYSKVVAVVYCFFGISRIIGQYLNILFSLTTIYIVFLIFQKLNLKQNICTFGIKIIALIPNFAIMSTTLIRESVIIMMLAFSTYCIVCWLYDSKYSNFVFP